MRIGKYFCGDKVYSRMARALEQVADVGRGE